jgi:hypothetical protein
MPIPTPCDFRVTWIAPEVESLPTLKWLSELGQIGQIEGVTLQTLTGAVTKPQVVNALKRRTHVMLWSGHGEPGGLCIPKYTRNGTAPTHDLVTPEWLAMYAVIGRPRLVILAACSSLLRDKDLNSMAEEISGAGLNVVGFPAAAEDAAVVPFNVELVTALANGAKLFQAFKVALNSIKSSATAAGVFLLPGYTNGNSELIERIETIESSMLDMHAEMKTGFDNLYQRLGIDAEPIRQPARRDC